jgi:hypothetical protein
MAGILEGGFIFPKAASASRTRTGSRKSTSVTKAKSGTPDVFAGIDVIPSTMDGVPAYSRMKQNKDKLLWVVKFAKGEGITGLGNKDIEWVTDHLGAGIPSKQITAAYLSARKAGYANKSTQDGKIRITPEGEMYLTTVGSDASA